MVFRSYEERGLGYDNAMDWVRVKANLAKGVYFKGVLGRQRFYFEKSPGLLRGVDAEINLSERWHALDSLGLRWTIGASYMSKYQRANDPFLVLPENVAAAGVRSQLMKGPWVLNTEFAYKANDPSADNGYIYKDGNGFIANLSYSKNGLGVIAGVKRIDNMSFRSDRNGSTIDMLVNYLSPTTEVHTYALPALYQYATQINGEEGIQLEANYRFKRKSKLGGKYGTLVSINYSAVQSIDKDYVAASNDTLRTLQGYYSDPLERGTIPYFHVGLEAYITIKHVEYMNIVIMLTGNLVGIAYLTELFMAWYSGVEFEQYAFLNRATGPYWWAYWSMMTCNVISPQLMWFKKLRTNIVFTFILALFVNIGMWFERFVIIVTSLHRDYLPSSWSMFSPTFVDVGIFVGSIGFFFVLFLLYSRTFPVIAQAELKTIVKSSSEQYKK